MNYAIDHKNKVIYFWVTKIGVTNVFEVIAHIKTEEIIQRPGQDEKVHQTFWKQYAENARENEDYSDYKKILFGRNPYHRIVSNFFDKVVCPNSPDMNIMPKVDNFYEFISLIHSCGMDQDKLSKHVDYIQFCHLNDFRGWKFYCEIGQPKFDVICITPETGLIEGKIILDYMQIEQIYNILGKEHLFEQSKILHKHNNYGAWNWYKKYPLVYVNEPDLHIKKISELQKYFWTDRNTPRTLRYMDFYNREMLEMFNRLYIKEFQFYNILNKYYKIDA